MIKYLRRTTSRAAGNGLDTTIMILRGAAGNGIAATIKYLRRTTRQTPGHHDKVNATQNKRRRGQRPGHYGEVYAMHNELRRGQRPETDTGNY
jgi:hypothetical protein